MSRFCIVLLLFFVLLGTGALAAGAPPPATPAVAPLKCLSRVRAQNAIGNPNLPTAMPAGIQNINRTPTDIITIFTPILSIQNPAASLINSNAQSFGTPLPPHFVVGDGDLDRVFIGVDKTPGSALDICAQEIISLMPPHSDQDLEPVFVFLQNHLIDYLAAAPEAGLDWDKSLPSGRSIPGNEAIFESAADLPVGSVPLPAKGMQPVVPLENYLLAGESYCIQKAIFAGIILEQLKIPYRLVQGASVTAGGHSWIQLDDGRILDPTWGTLSPSPSESAGASSQIVAVPQNSVDDFSVDGQSLVFEYQFYPMVVL